MFGFFRRVRDTVSRRHLFPGEEVTKNEDSRRQAESSVEVKESETGEQVSEGRAEVSRERDSLSERRTSTSTGSEAENIVEKNEGDKRQRLEDGVGSTVSARSISVDTSPAIPRTSWKSEQNADSAPEMGNTISGGSSVFEKDRKRRNSVAVGAQSPVTTQSPTATSPLDRPSIANEHSSADDTSTSQTESTHGNTNGTIAERVGSTTAPTSPLKGNLVSFSSQICAAWRMLEATRPEEERLFCDPLAQHLTHPAAVQRAQSSQYFAKALSRFSIRTRYFDDFSEKTVAEDPGIKQVVILGAGMDTRAYRLNLPSRGIIVYELDREEVIQLKERLLNKVDETEKELHCEELYRSATDLNEFGWEAPVICDGYDWTKKSLWLIEGLLYYFDEEGVEKIFRCLRRLTIPGSKICFSCIDARNNARPASANGIGDAAAGSTTNVNFDRGQSLPEDKDRLSKHFKWRCSDPARFVGKLGFNATSVVRLGGPEASYGLWGGSRPPSQVMYVKCEPV